MKLTIDLTINADRDQDGETAADEQRVLELASGLYRELTDRLLIAAKEEGLRVVLHQD